MQVCELLAVTEDGGHPAAMSWLDRHGIGYIVTRVPPSPVTAAATITSIGSYGATDQAEARALMAGLARELEGPRSGSGCCSVGD